jgi:hypothetical protein
MTPEQALRSGAARGLAAVLHARHPDLTFEVTYSAESDQAPGDRPPDRSLTEAAGKAVDR